MSGFPQWWQETWKTRRIQKWLTQRVKRATHLSVLPAAIEAGPVIKTKSASHTCTHTQSHTHTSDCFDRVYWGRSSPEAQGAETFPTKHSIVSVSKFMSIFRGLQHPATESWWSASFGMCVCVCSCVGDSSELPPQPELCFGSWYKGSVSKNFHPLHTYTQALSGSLLGRRTTHFLKQTELMRALAI